MSSKFPKGVQDWIDKWDRETKERDERSIEEMGKDPAHVNCDHGVSFDEDAFRAHENMPAAEVQRRWPRGWGPCPKGCGFDGIAYASYLHYIAGDW